MPIFVPIILGVAALSAMGWGTKKGYDGISDINEAQRIGAGAKGKYDRNQRILESGRADVNDHAHTFGVFKLEVARDTLGDMVRLLDELKSRGRLTSFETLQGIDFDSAVFIAAMRELSSTAASALGAAVLGAVKGSLTGAALYGLAGSIGVASTGAAISGLAGAAAQSATLAWLGGGALAAGGFGMFGGMVVLGGIAAAPVFLITGYQLASKGAEAITEATRYARDVDVAVSKMDAMNDALRLVRVRIDELTHVIEALRDRAAAQLTSLWNMVDEYDDNNRQHSAQLSAAMQLCKGLTDLMRAPIIVGDDGAPNPALPTLIATYRTLDP